MNQTHFAVFSAQLNDIGSSTMSLELDIQKCFVDVSVLRVVLILVYTRTVVFGQHGGLAH